MIPPDLSLPGCSNWLLALAAAVAYFLTSSFISWYRLRHIPGPFLASGSYLWLARVAKGGKQFWVYRETPALEPGVGDHVRAVLGLLRRKYLSAPGEPRPAEFASWPKRLSPGAKQGKDMLSVSSVIRSTMLYLMTTPLVYQGFKKEIMQVVRGGKTTSPITFEKQRRSLMYKPVIYEGIRVRPPAPGLYTKLVPPEGDVVHGKWMCAGKPVAFVELNKVFFEVNHGGRPEQPEAEMGIR
ncbi:hypothetical protein DL769_008243 [Monosporascus sp. CRB-8-3]|nr:hypothetical protein DL769_008243 [Monosporascus sp. CRB-8-3]